MNKDGSFKPLILVLHNKPGDTPIEKLNLRNRIIDTELGIFERGFSARGTGKGEFGWRN